MSQYQEYLSQREIVEIQQHITDVYGEDYLQPHEYHQLFNQIADSYIHDDDLYVSNNI
ncbi:hypothetical protein [Staphylococcus saprophyticus]|uniref:hypothetical protein n=1 Tax=Staphylococcus saprophyticus TaxID=29385 RepID=UPI0015D66C17|nr:hypothetical protein [Staphylococcus saprophyticus]